MKLAIMQPYIFPYIGYFQLIKEVDKFVIYDDVNFINRGWINRNNILVNGQAALFTVPLHKASQNKWIREVGIGQDPKWRKKLLKMLNLAYKKAPYFQEVFPLVEKVIEEEYANIAELALASIRAVADYLAITTKIENSSTIYQNNELKGQYRILDICLKEGAQTYINPIGGMELYDNSYFEEHKIDLRFIQTQSYTYTQLNKTFVPHLSIIDILMFNKKEEVHALLNQFELIKK